MRGEVKIVFVHILGQWTLSLSWKVDRVFDSRVLGARIRDQERKMITMGSETGHVSHDITPIHKVLTQVDDEKSQAEVLRNQYDKVFSTPVPEMKVNEEYFNETSEEVEDPRIFDSLFIDRSDIIDAIDQLSNHAAAGPDGFPLFLLKTAIFFS